MKNTVNSDALIPEKAARGAENPPEDFFGTVAEAEEDEDEPVVLASNRLSQASLVA